MVPEPEPGALTQLPTLGGSFFAAPALMTPPLPEMVDSDRVLGADGAAELEDALAALLAVVDSCAAELTADALAAGELSADCAALIVGAALDTTAGAEELALETMAEAEAAEDVVAADDVELVEEPVAAGVELPQADRPSTQAIRRAEVDFGVLFTVQTVAAELHRCGRSRKCLIPRPSAKGKSVPHHVCCAATVSSA